MQPDAPKNDEEEDEGPKEEIKEEKKEEAKKEEEGPPKPLDFQKALHDLKQAKKQEAEELLHKEFQNPFEQMGLSPDIINSTKLEDMQMLLLVKNILRNQLQVVMTNVLRIVLMKHEEKLACIITAYYDFYLEEDTFIASLAHENFEFMHYIWAFGKNYLGDGKRV